ncbi:endoplasmic reticulum mannosyl-oligosaccharide 1,2-alpha-mannosidase [Dactylonectria macrodidyma]|uniref:alpha-1,2-Mannosidase n=1 Tax=Dactylonectria macrodidyma TaxID=307937 RepID=A0A9P9JG72_9HYPO|nr:endoplasmic reticulum mannosyl-oligosaccharide 1,2-alpha-mannosidase [Dactylonectria macrodidyma]
MNSDPPKEIEYLTSSFNWSQVQFAYPPAVSTTTLPKARAKSFPSIQHKFAPESVSVAAAREERRQAVRDVFAKDWANYRRYAWRKDALNPISATFKDQFSGWAATLVDSLDTLWIMGMREEFDEAVSAVVQIDFGQSSSDRVNMFETTIRYLGGLLSAYDLSKRHVLLAKAVELGDLLYAGFNTPNRMPVDFIDFKLAGSGEGLIVEDWVVIASPGSLSMEMTHLSQLTGDMKYYDAISAVMRVFHDQQSQTRLPGLWPMWVSMKQPDVKEREGFTMGGGSDSAHEYLPKMYALLGGWDSMYENMTRAFMKAADEHLFFRPMLPGEQDILISGNVKVDDAGTKSFDPESEHLTCFIGGTMALAGRIFASPSDVHTGTKLARGCAYVYKAFPSGMMPERFNLIPCDPPRADVCKWDESVWVEERAKRPEWKSHLPKGFTTAKDARYLLRPEAIESLFVNYRITGDTELLDMAWDMFGAIANGSEVEFGHAAVTDVTLTAGNLKKEDYMESFWFAETLKYFYLMFSPPDLISLDEYVLNTEAHPFRMPVR